MTRAVVLACKVKTSLVLSEERWQLFLLFTKHRSVIACLLYWCLHTQVEEEHESRGGRRRTWDDEHVLKRQFSALVPAFDPRPGRTNIAQTQDIVIPAPGESLLLTNSSLILTYTWLIGIWFRVNVLTFFIFNRSFWDVYNCLKFSVLTPLD